MYEDREVTITSDWLNDTKGIIAMMEPGIGVTIMYAEDHSRYLMCLVCKDSPNMKDSSGDTIILAEWIYGYVEKCICTKSPIDHLYLDNMCKNTLGIPAGQGPNADSCAFM